MPRTLQLKEGEQLMTVAQAVEEVTGSRPHPTTCTRWVRKGAGGVVLPTVLLGQRRMTTPGAVREWIVERTVAASA